MGERGMRHIVLSESWAGYRKGSRLKVLLPGEEIEPKSVDAVRAAKLVEIGLAEDAAKLPKKALAPQEPVEEEVAHGESSSH